MLPRKWQPFCFSLDVSIPLYWIAQNLNSSWLRWNTGKYIDQRVVHSKCWDSRWPRVIKQLYFLNFELFKFWCIYLFFAEVDLLADYSPLTSPWWSTQCAIPDGLAPMEISRMVHRVWLLSTKQNHEHFFCLDRQLHESRFLDYESTVAHIDHMHSHQSIQYLQARNLKVTYIFYPCCAEFLLENHRYFQTSLHIFIDFI